MSNEFFAIAIVLVTTAGAISFIRGWVLMQRYFEKERAAKLAARQAVTDE
ncbi:MAG: hypothetical protein AAFO75_01200 [Pseudomonadota bacterium]